MDSEIEQKELENALEATKKTKRPGSDGLPYEFYESFWDIFGKEFLKVVRSSLNEAKCSPYSQTVSLIRASHKKGERRRLTNHWRSTIWYYLSKSIERSWEVCGDRGRCIAHNFI